MLMTGVKCESYVASPTPASGGGDSPAKVSPPPPPRLSPSPQLLLPPLPPVSQQQQQVTSAGSVHRISPDTRERLKQTLLSVRVRKRKLAASLEADNAMAAGVVVPKLPKLPLTAPILGESASGPPVWNQSLTSAAVASDITTSGLDADTINFIHHIYCQECRMEADKQRVQGHDQQLQLGQGHVEKTLLMRRSLSELVGQGINMSAMRTPVTNFAEQTRQLELAKTGGKKLAGKSKRQCKEACSKLSQVQEKLSQHLLTRPGPLELVQSNILPADADLKQAINEGTLQFQTSACAALQLYGGLPGDDLDLSPDCPSDTASSQPPSGDLVTISSFPTASMSCTNGCLQVSSDDAAISTVPEIGPLLLQQQQQASSCASLSPTSYAAMSPMSSPSSSSSSTSTTLDSGRSSATGSSIGGGQNRKSRKNGGHKKTSSKQSLLGGGQKGQRMFKFHYYNSKFPDKSSLSSSNQQQQLSPAESPPALSCLPSADALAQTPCSSSSGNSSGASGTEVCSAMSKQHLDSILQQQFLFLHWQERQKQLALASASSVTCSTSQMLSNCTSIGSSTTASNSLNSNNSATLFCPLQLTSTVPKPPMSLMGKGTAPVNTVAPTIVNKLPTVDTVLTTTTLPPISHLVNKPVIQMTSIPSTVALTPQQQLHEGSLTKATDTSERGKINKLESLTVKQLKAELKARCMAATGTKPHLVERLRCHEQAILQSLADNATSSEDSSLRQQAVTVQSDETSLDEDLHSNVFAKPSLVKRTLSSATNNDTSSSLEMSRPSSTIPMTDGDVAGANTLQTGPTKSVAMTTPLLNCVATNVMMPGGGGGYTMSVNPLMWQQAAMMGMQMFAASPSAVQQATQQQQFLQLMVDPRNWLAMQQLVQQQMLVCSQSMQQATARVQQQQAALLALQQQQQPSSVTPALPQPASTLSTSPTTNIVSDSSAINTDSPKTTPSATVVKSPSWPTLNGTTGTAKSMSNEEMLLLQQQQQIQQLHTALHQSQQRLAEAEQQAESQAKYWAMLQQQFMASMASSSYQQQQHLPLAMAATPHVNTTGTVPSLPPPTVIVTPATPVSPVPPVVHQPQQQTLPSISVLQQDLKCGMKMSAASQLSTSPAFVFTSTQQQHQQDSAPLTSISMPASPVAGHTRISRMVTDSMLGALEIPEKTPPKYDEVVKNGQFIKHGFEIAAGNSSKPEAVKNINIDDVLDLLIQQGEISHDSSSSSPRQHQLLREQQTGSPHMVSFQSTSAVEISSQQMHEHFPAGMHGLTPAPVNENFFDSSDAGVSFGHNLGTAQLGTSQVFNYGSHMSLMLEAPGDGGLQQTMMDAHGSTSSKMTAMNDITSNGNDHFAFGGCSFGDLPFMEWADSTDGATSGDLMSRLLVTSGSNMAERENDGAAATSVSGSIASVPSTSSSFEDDLIVSEFLNLPHEICNVTSSLTSSTKPLTPASGSLPTHMGSTGASQMLSSNVLQSYSSSPTSSSTSPISYGESCSHQLRPSTSSAPAGDFDWCDAISSGLIGGMTSASSTRHLSAKCHDVLDLFSADDLHSSLDFDMSFDRVLVTTTASSGT